MWYWDMDTDIYDISALATAESIDGVNWTNDAPITQDPSAILVTGGAAPAWNHGTYGPISMFYQQNTSNTGTEPWNYRYVMYYDGTDGKHEITGMAYSTDGSLWTAYSGSPVLPTSVAPAWDCNSSARDCFSRRGGITTTGTAAEAGITAAEDVPITLSRKA